MGRKKKRMRLANAIARRDERVAAEAAASNATFKAENSVKIEEMKVKSPAPVIEEPVKIQEPMFAVQPKVPEAPKQEIEKPEIKKTSDKKVSPQRTTKAKTPSRNTRNKKK
jgi:hypothetical protein|tara:strand:+ start:303 stop:635 length:333 start_codon:yes stop_codon:yes gene_type:complete